MSVSATARPLEHVKSTRTSKSFAVEFPRYAKGVARSYFGSEV